MRPVDEIGHVRIVARHQAQLRTRALWKCNGLCIIVRFKKSLDLLRTFFSEYRTDGIEELAAGSDDGPKGFQKAFLLLREGNNIVRATRKNDLGVTTHDAACRAGCIKQDGIKRLAIPPTGDVGRVAHANICPEIEARMRLDSSRLPKPLQVIVGGNSDWELDSDWITIDVQQALKATLFPDPSRL